ncbi:hypothetical protein EHRUM4_10050 [Ehrlichia ruminantium]|uniref:Uncharacterized protein n=1 Tax=Ehrlichia ruminantium TaxID=779 RepID=A0A170S8J5_EHRRU|nr:hypothetical protein EHRUM4_10050 [Ehrlichia ruminantium]GAT77748.1 hypothetical protein EHRUM2_09780 [Ehrlichia ruminantium]GAT78932.1 hypothetical protein EHRUM3_11650 [Ehrlichia ruminantium]
MLVPHIGKIPLKFYCVQMYIWKNNVGTTYIAMVIINDINIGLFKILTTKFNCVFKFLKKLDILL